MVTRRLFCFFLPGASPFSFTFFFLFSLFFPLLPPSAALFGFPHFPSLFWPYDPGAFHFGDLRPPPPPLFELIPLIRVLQSSSLSLPPFFFRPFQLDLRTTARRVYVVPPGPFLGVTSLRQAPRRVSLVDPSFSFAVFSPGRLPIAPCLIVRTLFLVLLPPNQKSKFFYLSIFDPFVDPFRSLSLRVSSLHSAIFRLLAPP